MEIKRIVNSVFTSNTYILETVDGVWLVDCGDTDPILTMGKPVKGVLLTHAHFDHIYGLPRLIEEFPDMKIYTSKNGVEGLANDRINFSRYHDEPLVIGGENVVAIGDGEEIRLSDELSARAISTEGHDYSCLSYILDDKLFTGDSWIPGLKTITTFPKSNKTKAVESERRLKELAMSGYSVYPGHGPIFSYPLINIE